MRANSNNKSVTLHHLGQTPLDGDEVDTDKPPADPNNPERFGETKWHWPGTDTPSWSMSAQSRLQPLLILSPASLTSFPDVAIEMPAVVPAAVSESFANTMLHDVDSLRSVTEFLDLAEVVAFSRTTRANNAFVRNVIPQVQSARDEHRLLMERYRSARIRDKLAVFMAISAGASFLGGVVANFLYTDFRVNGGDYSDAFDATVGLEAAVPLAVALSIIARRSASRLRQTQSVPANPGEALAQARDQFDRARDSRRQELEANRALARRPAWQDEA